ncbi:MAG TPA: flagellar biosynthetic protein FliR [Rhodothermales bacterium]|nr:flagellar biosynthetic protein FliR [Rhodothermales bacterium]
MALNPEYILRIFLIFVRIGAVLMVAPFFNHPSVPIRIKVFFSLLLAFSLSGVIPGTLPPYADTTVGMGMAIAVEAITGIAIGFAGQLIFWSIQFAGEIIGFEVGLSMSQAFDPTSNSSNNVMGRFLALTFLLVFVLLDGHHQILLALAASFQVVPLAGAHVAAVGPFLMSCTGGFLETALRLAAPFMVTIALVDTSLAVLGRVAPQTDLFSISLPLKLLVGLGLAYFFMQEFFPVIPTMIDHMTDDILHMLEAIAPR